MAFLPAAEREFRKRIQHLTGEEHKAALREFEQAQLRRKSKAADTRKRSAVAKTIQRRIREEKRLAKKIEQEEALRLQIAERDKDKQARIESGAVNEEQILKEEMLLAQSGNQHIRQYWQWHKNDNPKDPFIEKFAERADFQEILAESAIANPKISLFLKLIGEVAPDRTFTDCARMAKITSTDLAKIWKDAKLSRAYFRIVDRMEQVADKVVSDALGAQKACSRCDGLGRIKIPDEYRDFFDGQDTSVCPQCEGKKVQIAQASNAAVERIWERVGWVQKSSGVNVNVNLGDHSIDSTIAELDSDDILDI